MTKNTFKKGLALLLAVLMLCSLCACGGKSESKDEQEANQNNKEFVAAYTSEYPYLQLINLSFVSGELDCMRYVAASGKAYRPPYWDFETDPQALGNNVIGLTEDYVLHANGTVTSHSSNSDPTDCGLSNVVEIEQGDVNNDTGLIALRSDGTIHLEHVGSSDFYKAEEWTDIIAISASTTHLVGLKSDGTVVATGGNYVGACNVESWTDIIAIGTATHYYGGATYGVKKDGTVVTTEEGYDVSSWTDIVAIAAADNFVMGLKADGTVVASGEDYNGETKTSGWTDIVAIQAYKGLSIGIKADGTVVSAGDDYVISKYLKDVKIKVD